MAIDIGDVVLRAAVRAATDPPPGPVRIRVASVRFTREINGTGRELDDRELEEWARKIAACAKNGRARKDGDAWVLAFETQDSEPAPAAGGGS